MVFKAGRPGPRHPIDIRFGEPIRSREGEDPSEVMERVRLFLAESGAEHRPRSRGRHHAPARLTWPASSSPAAAASSAAP